VKQFKNYANHSQFLKVEEHPEEDDTAVEILTEKVKSEISAAGFEAAAISAAIDFEKSRHRSILKPGKRSNRL